MARLAKLLLFVLGKAWLPADIVDLDHCHIIVSRGIHSYPILIGLV